ncbi:MAG: SWIM zinc finger family protein, partial [Burkholderiales bacterium]|nr:SWIM zinc finger family protein [Burkholderiales bacterium]
MITEYGTTWWGQKWLAALTDIDEENRIPRGKTYANTGKVFDFKIRPKKREIAAKVKGKYQPSYKVDIHLPEIPQNKMDKLIDKISNSPLVLAKLATRELDPEILNLAESCGIELFPKRWSDLGMHCTCPDYAVPCKHLAAVIYTISQEIDSNPFLIFELHGVDLINHLKNKKKINI